MTSSSVEGRDRRRVLVIEDDDEVRKLFRIILRVHGCEVVEAADGPQGLKELEAETPDLVLLDIAMPGPSGWEVLEEIRARHSPDEVPVIVVSGYAQPGHVARAQALGIAGCLTKPVAVDELMLLVGQVLPEASPGEGASES